MLNFRLKLFAAVMLNIACFPGASKSAPTHPVLLFSSSDIPTLKEKAASTPEFRTGMDAFLEKAAKTSFKAYSSLPTSVSPYSLYGEILPILALEYLLTGEKSILEDVAVRIDKLTSYSSWGKGKEADTDLAASHILFGMSIAYDWLFPHVSEDRRKKWAKKIEIQAESMYQAVEGGKSKWWATTYNQNHNHINVTSLLAAGLVLNGESSEAAKWIRTARKNFEQYFAIKELVGDGSESEGSGYATYGQAYLIISVELLKRHFGENYYEKSSWLTKLAGFYAATSSPDFKMSDGFCDTMFRYNTLPVHILYALDREYRTGHGNWLAARILSGKEKNLARMKSLPFELIFFDGDVEEKQPDQAQGIVHFPDWGTAFYKNGTGEGMLYAGFKCSPPGGRAVWDMHLAGDKRMKRYNVGHCHPDANSFFLHPRGKMFLTDSGYEWPKATENHNTLLFDGKGQVGDGDKWFGTKELAGHASTPEFILAAAENGFALFAGEASGAYSENSGVTTFFRQILVLPDGSALIYDYLDLTKKLTVTHCFNSIKNSFIGGKKRAHVDIDGERFILECAEPGDVSFKDSVFRNTAKNINVNVGKVKVQTNCGKGEARFLYAAFSERSPLSETTLLETRYEKTEITFSHLGRKYLWSPAPPSSIAPEGTRPDDFSTLTDISSDLEYIFH